MERYTVKGQCLCGAIAFVVEPLPDLVFNCHCSRCRVSHGADYATQVFADRASLEFLRGQDDLTEYESTGGLRCFCKHCGSRLMNYAKDNGDYLSVAAACLDDTYRGRAIAHCFVSAKARWHEPAPGIEQHQELPATV